MRVHELTWDEFVYYMCETRDYLPNDWHKLTDDEWFDLRKEYQYGAHDYSVEANDRGWKANKEVAK